MSFDKQNRPSEPEIGHTAWYLGWEISYDVEASLWGAEGWRAYKGGPDLDAPHTSARTFPELIEEIEAEELPL